MKIQATVAALALSVVIAPLAHVLPCCNLIRSSHRDGRHWFGITRQRAIAHRSGHHCADIPSYLRR
ncbi:MAG: hypothetical protein ACLQIK_17190 [Mycobacterium sp.]|uniref:hypothetical protein n=1 Tax=Mycobacterium sp. TaxID=1785 RepID=UPI003F94A32D